MSRTTNRTQTTVFLGALLATALAPMSAHALQGGEDPALLPVLINKQYGNDSAHQLTLAFATSFATKYVEATGIYGSYGYNFSDIFGLELGGGYFFGSESAIMRTVRDNFGTTEPPLSDLYQLQWMANLDAMLVPFYGRFSFASEIDPSWDVFAVAGVGVMGVRKQFGSDAAGNKAFESKVTPGFNFGAGLRFYFNLFETRTALRLEFRDYFFPDPESNPANDPEKQTDPFTWNLMFQAGLQFTFGGI